MSFGFSSGDSITAITLIHKVVQSLRTASGAKAAHRELCIDLEGLTNVLRRVNNLELQGHGDETAHLRHECEACLKKIFDFGRKIQKFRPSLQSDELEDPVYEVERFWHKIEWSLLKEDEVKAFNMDLAPHLQRVEMEQNILLLKLRDSVR